jgi:hypothetical protein
MDLSGTAAHVAFLDTALCGPPDRAGAAAAAPRSLAGVLAGFADDGHTAEPGGSREPFSQVRRAGSTR